jgi:hypothetical protein
MMGATSGAPSVTLGQQSDGSKGEFVARVAKADGLTFCALAYLAIPNLIFVLGWFSPLPAFVLCAAALFLVARQSWSTLGAHAPGPTRATLLWTGMVSCAWSAFGGGSHFMYANLDWVVRDALLGDLIRFDWPIHYLTATNQALVLRSAIGFFLPPALFGKIFGFAYIDLAIYAWTALGVQIFLLLLPLPKQGQWRIGIALIIVVFFSGMDFLGQLITTGWLPMFPLRLEWWVPISYPSFSAQLLWAPNHCLPIWICTALYLRHRQHEESLSVSAVALPMSLIWTPFAAIGLLPFVILSALNHLHTWGWRRVPWSTILAAITYSLPIGLFLLIDFSRIEAVTPLTPSPQTATYPLQAFSLDTYFLFVSCEFLLLGLVLAPHIRHARTEFWLAIALLLAIPLVRLGPSNDFGLRLSAPALVILLAACLRMLLAQPASVKSLTGCLTITFLLVGAPTAVHELWRAATFPRTPADYRTTLAERQGGLPAPHYVGHLDRYLLRSWLKPSAASPLAK